MRALGPTRDRISEIPKTAVGSLLVLARALVGTASSICARICRGPRVTDAGSSPESGTRAAGKDRASTARGESAVCREFPPRSASTSGLPSALIALLSFQRNSATFGWQPTLLLASVWAQFWELVG